jgi:hypothetical protein
MPLRRMSWLAWVAVFLFLLAVSLPYLYALVAAGDRHVFTGLLFNPLDGNSYLAKMYQGIKGAWRFRLPYTAEPGQGAYLFLYYLFLGQAAKLLGAPIAIAYHVARLAGALFMIYAIFRFYAAILSESRQVWLAFGLALLGGGIGWLALPTGAVTADFWVAEAYPFLSAYANPHFPLTLGLLLWTLTPPGVDTAISAPVNLVRTVLQGWKIAPLVFLLALISPFAVVIAGLVLGGVIVLGYLLDDRVLSPAGRQYLGRLVWTSVIGAPVLVYDQWATMRSPQLSAWNAQNVTPAPAPWDFLLSFSPLLILAALGVWRLLRDRRVLGQAAFDPWLVPIVWVVLGILLLYTPLNLQRRFILGLYAPLCALAVWGVAWLAGSQPRRFRLIAIALFILVLPTNLFVILAAQHGIQGHDPLLYLDVDEAAAFHWLRQQPNSDALVLASPRTGLLIPANTGLRVVYGHPYETVEAERNKQAVEDFFSAGWDVSQKLDYLGKQSVDYIFVGPQERELGIFTEFPGTVPVFQSGLVTIYAFQPELTVVMSQAVWPEAAWVVW